MVVVKRFRTNWGIDPTPDYANYREWFPKLKVQGYAGVEVNLHTIDNPELLKSICDENNLEINVLIFSAWPRYRGPRPRLTVQEHLIAYKEQLIRAKAFDPSKVNAQSGSDVFTYEQSVEFFQGTLTIDAELGLSGIVCHETHRNRSLFSPYAAEFILKRVPELRITADFSHWVVGCERLLDVAEEDIELMERIYPHVYHIHSRIGTTQASQCPDPSDPVYEAEVKSFENIWKAVIRAQILRDGKDSTITFVPEWGPYPYHPHNSSRDFSEVADTEGARHQELFQRINY
ncbi:hypothetical protein V2G26_002426 [Clonostachys chloroleuca]